MRLSYLSVAGFFCASVLAVPPTPVADPSGIPKNRYLSMSVPSNGGEPMALRVTLVALHHVNPPYIAQPTPPPFSSFEGEYRWVGPPVFATENDNDPTPFIAAPLQCTPYYHDWSTLGLFHVYGDAVIPSSAYEVVALDESCTSAEEGCVDISSALPISTSRFGDVTSPFHPPATTTQPDIADVSSVVSKASRAPLSQSKASEQLQPNIPDPTRAVNVWDCIMEGNAYAGYGYPWGGPTSCGAPQNASSEPPTGNVAAARANPTLRVFITPVPAQGTSSYPAGTQIVGQELIATSGGFRAFFNVQFQDFNPDNVVSLRGYQIQVDAEGMRGINANPPAPGVDMALPQEP